MDPDQTKPDVRHAEDGHMSKTLRLRRSSDQTGDRKVDHQIQHAEQWNHEHQDTDQPKKLSNGHFTDDDVNLFNGVPANDGSNEETKPLVDPPINAVDLRHDCPHCHYGADKSRDYMWIEGRPTESSTETRSKEDVLIRSIRPVPITIQRKPFIAKPDSKLRNAGT
jgi:hypothetical protein